MNQNTENAVMVDRIAALTAAGLETFEVAGVPQVILPPGYMLEDMEQLLPTPNRIKQAIGLADAKSFIDYFQRFASDTTVIFANQEARQVKAVFDYHTTAPAWCSHSATLALAHSDEWKAWAGQNGKSMLQRAFAEFVEDHIRDVVEPAGAELLEVAKTLHANKKLQFRSGAELHNGQVQLTYNEVIEGQAGAKGQLEIPRTIKLGLRVFKGTEPYAVSARLRYRISDEGVLSFSYHLDDLDRVLEDAFEQVLTQIRTNCNGAPLFKQ